MKYIKAIISWLGMVILGMMGGQGKIGGKSTRRFGMPALATAFATWWDGFQLKDLSFLLCIPILSLGYGEHSIFYQWFWQSDTIVRIVYAILLSLPFLFYGLLRWGITVIAFIIAFQIHLGSAGDVSWFGDILIDDIIRYGAWASAVLMCVIWKKK